MGGARSWGAAAVVAVLAAVGGPSVAGAADPPDRTTLATTLTGSRVPGGGPPAWVVG